MTEPSDISSPAQRPERLPLPALVEAVHRLEAWSGPEAGAPVKVDEAVWQSPLAQSWRKQLEDTFDRMGMTYSEAALQSLVVRALSDQDEKAVACPSPDEATGWRWVLLPRGWTQACGSFAGYKIWTRPETVLEWTTRRKAWARRLWWSKVRKWSWFSAAQGMTVLGAGAVVEQIHHQNSGMVVVNVMASLASVLFCLGRAMREAERSEESPDDPAEVPSKIWARWQACPECVAWLETISQRAVPLLRGEWLELNEVAARHKARVEAPMKKAARAQLDLWKQERERSKGASAIEASVEKPLP